MNRDVFLGNFPARNGSPTRIFASSGVALAALALLVVLLPSSGWAANTTKNCPVEPVQNTPIVSGETYTGTNCLLKTTGDFDSFTFTAAVGDTWSMFAGVAPNPLSNICLNLYAPGSNGTATFTGCTSVGIGVASAGTTMKLTVAGVYTISVTETANGNTGYGLSLERINPPPLDATALTLSTNVTGLVSVPTQQVAYTFYGATSGVYQITGSYTSGNDNLCLNVYQSGTSVLSQAPCTSVGIGVGTITAKVTPATTGTFVVVVYAATNDSTVNYNLEVSCILGTCPNGPPKCSLTDAATYDGTTGTLTMNFTLATPTAATWNGWLTSQNSIQSMWSQAQPVTTTIMVTKTQTGVAKAGKVGILSTLTTPTAGITCSSWQLINTGTP